MLVVRQAELVTVVIFFKKIECSVIRNSQQKTFYHLSALFFLLLSLFLPKEKHMC